QVESQVSVAQSNSVLLRAIAAIDLTKNPEFNGSGMLDRWLGMLFGSDDGDRTAETLDALRRRLAVKRDDKVLVLNIIVTAKSADLAAKLANAIA
ncbi:lipopolysaccharide biosynthesis protein, partial [Mesorhizobium sp. M2D.F.Ca.ET.223.01.1.1]